MMLFMIELLKRYNLITKNDKINNNNKRIVDNHPDLLDRIIAHTCFLIGENITLKERLYVIQQKISHQPVCKECNRAVRIKADKRAYPNFCSVKCSRNNIETKKQFENTNVERYGTSHPCSSEEIKFKIKTTKNNQTPEQKAEATKKRQQTVLKKYGTLNTYSVPDIAEKRKHTNLQKYGTEFVSQSPE